VDQLEDDFAVYLQSGKPFVLSQVEIILDKRGVPFRWTRFECLHCQEIAISYKERKNRYSIDGIARFEQDNWSSTTQGDFSQQADEPCEIHLEFEWPDDVKMDSSVNVYIDPGSLRAIIEFFHKEWRLLQA